MADQKDHPGGLRAAGQALHLRGLGQVEAFLEADLAARQEAAHGRPGLAGAHGGGHQGQVRDQADIGQG